MTPERVLEILAEWASGAHVSESGRLYYLLDRDQVLTFANRIAAEARSQALDGNRLLGETPLVETAYGSKEPNFRMDAYYYGFGPTGVLGLDLLLSAVACAGKAYHHTDCWGDECEPYHEGLRGSTPIQWIENAADDLAKAILALKEKL